MSLSLLAPAALGLALLGALPLIAHMARQRPRDRQAFGAMLLLQRVVKRLRRRRRLKDPLLLALRLLAMLLVVLGSVSPRLSWPGDQPALGGSGRVVVIVDRSLSMSLQDGGSTLLARARDQAAQTVRDLPEGTLAAAVAFDSEAERLVPSLTADHGRILERIDALQPSSGTSDLRGALLEARQLLGGEPGEVLVYSDQAGPRMVGEAVPELEALLQAGSSVIPVLVAGDPPRNVAITRASYGEGIEGGQVTVRITNFGPDPIEVPCEVILPDGARIPIFADLPPQGEAEEQVTVPREALGGVGRATCEDPDLALDDSRYFHLPRVGASRVMVVDGDPGDTPVLSEVYFLERALAPWGGVRTGVTPDVVPPAGLGHLDPERHRVVFLANVSDPRPHGPRLVEFVRKGGALVMAAGDNITAERYNAALGSVLPSPVRRARDLADPGEQGVSLALPDLEHALFTPFARTGRGGFGRVRAHRVLTLEPYDDSSEVHTLLRFEGGVPALIERQVGQGRVLLWTGSLDLAWSNLPLQSVFMPLVQRMVGWLGGEAGGGAARFEATAGELVSLPLPEMVLAAEIIGPSGAPVRSRVEASRLLFIPPEAGAYAMRIEDAPPLVWVAVNTPPHESDTRAYESLAAVERELVPELFLRHARLGPWATGIGLILLVFQALIALWRRP